MKGICFIEPLFYKVVNGEKTQTRRIIKPQPDEYSDLGEILVDVHHHVYRNDRIKARYKPGETLYLKEPYLFGKHGITYKYGNPEHGIDGGWNNKLFMPEKYARHLVEITSVRTEGLQDISDGDCMKEGIEFYDGYSVNEFACRYVAKRIKGVDFVIPFKTPQEAYAALIDKINGKDTWESNPWVWVYDFRLKSSNKFK